MTCPYYLSGFNQILKCRQVAMNIFGIKFIAKLLMFIQLVTRGREEDRKISRRVGDYFPNDLLSACPVKAKYTLVLLNKLQHY
jgi:hypothetical protein